MQQLTKSEKIHLSTTEISKRVKQHLKKEFPHCKFSVRSEYYSMGSSLHVSLIESDRKIIKPFNELSGLAIHQYTYDGRYTRENLENLQSTKYHQLNQYRFNDEYEPDNWNNGVFLTQQGFNLLKRVSEIVQQYNYDDSDIQTDHFDVNFYFHLNLGTWDKPMVEVKQNGK